jgi:hypothetical protein
VIKDGAAGPRELPEATEPAAHAAPRLRRWVWPATFAAMAAFLLLRSSFLFTTRLYECGDPAANSILVEQAEHFTLLHGNYSREEFFHPGPAYLYLMAAGQWLLHDLTHLVPTAWNGQLIAILLLNSALMATVAWIMGDWAGSAWATLAAAAVIFGFAAALSFRMPVALNPEILASNWMPDVYMPTFLAFVVVSSSVAAGRTQHLWLVAVTGGLLIHGHVEFLFFVPLIVAAAAAGALWPSRRAPWTAVRGFLRQRRPEWVPAVAVGALFALPIAADLAAHWPGEFGKYLSYARSARAGHHPLSQAVGYLLWYWLPGPAGLGLLFLGVLAVMAALAMVVAFPAAAAGLRRFLLAALGIVAVTTAAMLYYAARGIDHLYSYYIGLFYFSVPLLTLLVVVTGLTAAYRSRAITRVILTGAALLALGAAAAAPGLRADVHDNEPALAPAMAALVARTPGKLIVLDVLGPGAPFDADGLVIQAERSGVPICLTGPYFFVFAVTSQFICQPRQKATGVRYLLHRRPYRPPPGVPVIARLRYSVLTPDELRGGQGGRGQRVCSFADGGETLHLLPDLGWLVAHPEGDVDQRSGHQDVRRTSALLGVEFDRGCVAAHEARTGPTGPQDQREGSNARSSAGVSPVDQHGPVLGEDSVLRNRIGVHERLRKAGRVVGIGQCPPE